MKIIVTGTHFTPAVAVCEQFKKYSDIEIVYVGRRTTLEGDKSQSVESKILPEIGVKFIPLTAGRLQGNLTIYTIISLLKVPIGLLQSFYIILSERADIILSFGGYVSLPIVFAGWLFSIPIITHEQTLAPGLANKINSFFANKIAISFSQNKISEKQTILTGNPLRQTITQIQSQQYISDIKRFFKLAKRDKLPVIVVTGGNQGSHIINLTVEKSLEKLTKLSFVIHITGDNKYKDFDRLKNYRSERYIVKKWINIGWGKILSNADLIISRSGINTLSELAYLGKPALVVPIPYIFSDEQNKNAKYFEKLGLVKILPQSELSKDTLLSNIKKMLNQLNKWQRSARIAKSIIIPSAAKRLALETVLLLKSEKLENKS